MSPAALSAVLCTCVLVACGGAHIETDNTIPSATDQIAKFMVADSQGILRKAFIFRSPHPSPGGPWVMYAPTFTPGEPGGLPDIEYLYGSQIGSYFAQWSAAGISVAGVDVGESYGSPAGRAIYTRLFEKMVAAGFSSTPALLARSRGGLMVYCWAADRPNNVSAIAGVYPVGDMSSYPGLSNGGLQSAWGMTEAQLLAALPVINPVNRLGPLVADGVPIFHVHGDSDVVVPIGPNSQTVKNNYDALHGEMTLEIIPGAGHSGFEAEFFGNPRLAAFVIAKAR